MLAKILPVPIEWLIIVQILHRLQVAEGAIAAPPWANPKLNPCAIHPMGWQMLYWPPDGACYKIFQLGHPCPDDMELTPSASGSNAQKVIAECRCPPKTTQWIENGHCYQLFTAGPCPEGSYFAVQPAASSSSKRKYGACRELERCPPGHIFWPMDQTCRKLYTRGPCARGLMLTKRRGLPECRCDDELADYRAASGKCYQHYTRGPCEERGALFLEDRTCGCHSGLPHYHNGTGMCYELDTVGPCHKGETFKLSPDRTSAACECKDDHIRYRNSTSCYRPFTQGPCPERHFLVNTTSCIVQPCARGYLFVARDRACHRVGTRGPCPRGHVVNFDFRTRPSIDGVSYNGVCACAKEGCSAGADDTTCDKGWIRYRGRCRKLYARGPCRAGAWIAPRRASLGRDGACECVPGYVEQVNAQNEVECAPPTVILAEYLNKTYRTIVQRSVRITERIGR